MVMETESSPSSPSPQAVGREFVRQYYTLMHEQPAYLWRFYSHESSFIHGGSEKPGEENPPIQGQNAIRDKIDSLQLDGVVTRIHRVDAQSTVQSAVVVQVTGELANNNGPMRKFMQTCVLAPQGPKKYYVHNNIFRYEDETFASQSTCISHSSDVEDSKAITGLVNVTNGSAAELGGADSRQVENYSNSTSSARKSRETAGTFPRNRSSSACENEVQQLQSANSAVGLIQAECPPRPASVSGTGTGHFVVEAEQTRAISIAQNNTTPSTQHTVDAVAAVDTFTSGTGGGGGARNWSDAVKESEEAEADQHCVPDSTVSSSIISGAPPVPTGGIDPCSRLVDGQAHQYSSADGVPHQNGVLPAAQQPSSDRPEEDTNAKSYLNSKKSRRNSNEWQQPGKHRNTAPPQSRTTAAGFSGAVLSSKADKSSAPATADHSPPVQRERIPDLFQLFVGNLPQDIRSEELMDYFSRFGKVTDIKLHHNEHGSGFGFVAFESMEGPRKAIESSFQHFIRSSHRINVEAKKPRGGGANRMGNAPRTGGFGGPGQRAGSGGGGGGVSGAGRNNNLQISRNRGGGGGGSGRSSNRSGTTGGSGQIVHR